MTRSHFKRGADDTSQAAVSTRRYAAPRRCELSVGNASFAVATASCVRSGQTGSSHPSLPRSRRTIRAETVHLWSEFWPFGLTSNEKQIPQIVEKQ